jgi:hypothetical protein
MASQKDLLLCETRAARGGACVFSPNLIYCSKTANLTRDFQARRADAR